MQIDEIHADPYGLGYFVAYAEIFLQRGSDLTLESVAEWGFQQPMLWQEEASYLSIHGYRKDPDAVKYLPMRERARKAYVRKASKHLWAESYLRSTPLRGVDFGSSLRIDLVDNSGRPKADGNMVCLRIGMDIDHYSLRFTDFSDLVLNVPFRDKISRGSVFQISRFVSPTTFLIGLNFDPMDPRPRHRNQLSRDYRENNCEGFSGFGYDEWIRTVFPVNLLTNQLLDMPWSEKGVKRCQHPLICYSTTQSGKGVSGKGVERKRRQHPLFERSGARGRGSDGRQDDRSKGADTFSAPPGSGVLTRE